MKKKLLIILLLITLIATCLTAFVGCEKETVVVSLNYTITTQYESFCNNTKGEIVLKPSDPTFINSTFNAGIGAGTIPGYSDFDLPMPNPRMTEGYDVNTDYYFVGWYKEPEYITEWRFCEDRVFVDTTLYAKWIVKTW